MENDPIDRLFLKLARDGDAVSVKKLLSLEESRSWCLFKDAKLMNYQAAENGQTAILLTTLGGHAAVTELIIAARCNVDLQTKNGCTPLYCAAEEGHEAVTKQLIEARYNVDLQEEDGCTPLFIAALKGHAAALLPS